MLGFDAFNGARANPVVFGDLVSSKTTISNELYNLLLVSKGDLRGSSYPYVMPSGVLYAFFSAFPEQIASH